MLYTPYLNKVLHSALPLFGDGVELLELECEAELLSLQELFLEGEEILVGTDFFQRGHHAVVKVLFLMGKGVREGFRNQGETGNFLFAFLRALPHLPDPKVILVSAELSLPSSDHFLHRFEFSGVHSFRNN